MTNKELLKNAGVVIDKLTGINKDVGGSINLGTTDFGQLLPVQEVHEMINLTTDQSDLLKDINTVTRQRTAGTVPIYNLEGQIMEYVGEQDPAPVTSRPETKNVEYRTRKHKCDIVISYEDIREAEAAGIGNFEKKITDSFITQLGNNVCDVIISGNRNLNGNTRLNRMLRGVDGLEIKTAQSNIFNANGWAFDEDIFIAMRDEMPEKYRRIKKELRWLHNDRVSSYWKKLIKDRNTNLGDQALINSMIAPPEGIKPITVDQISAEKGSTPIAPTAVANNTTYVTVTLTTLVTAGNPASAAEGENRRFKVTCKTTGQYEICTGYLDSTVLKVDTTTLLGQTTVSTTASDYEVSTYDETDIYLAHPKAINLVWCQEWRAYREYNKNFDQFEITIYLEFDLLVPVPEAIVKYTNIAVPPIRWRKTA